MEASMNVGVRPIERPQAPSVDGVGRRGDGGGSSAAFSPKTNVSIQNAVDDMAGVLAKISTNQMDAVEKMPEDLQRLIKNVMKQAFSLEETLAQGLGSTLESQRFSMEQLSSFSRMLTQMGKLMERGMTMEVSDTMQALLTNLKNLTSTEQGPALEPVLLTKAAFELLDNKPFAELPKEVQQMLLTLAPQGMVQQLPTGETNSLNFLKQLVQYFMPRPASSGETMQSSQGQSMPNNIAQPQQGQPMPNNMAQPQQGQPMSNNMAQSQQGQPMPNNMAQPQQGQVMPNNTAQPQQGQSMPNNMAQPQQGQVMPNNMVQPQQGQAMPNNTAQPQQGQVMPNNTAQPQQGQPMPNNMAQPQQGQVMPNNTAQPQQGQAMPNNMAQPQQGQAMPNNMAQPQQGQVMPNNTAQPQQGQVMPNNTAQPQQGQAMPNNMAQPQQGQAMPNNMAQPQQGQAMPNNMAQPQQGQAMPNNMAQPQQGQAMPNNMAQPQQGQPMPNNTAQPQQGQPMPNNTAQPQQGQPMPNNMAQSQQGQPVQRNVHERMPQAEQVQRPQQAAMQQAKNQLLDQVMENTPQTMNVLKDLAQLLLKDGNVNQKDALLLQSFINGKEALLSAKETQQLQQMIRLCQANIPATVQQAALQQNIPDLPRLWAFMQLCDMAYTRNMTARQLKKAGKDVAAFVLSMRNSMEGDNSIVPGQRSLNFMMPMYMGEESTYPAYIHVYDEKQPDPETGEMKKETWLRLCVLTDNIGAVELTCRVYQENQLDMRLFFSSTETANEFRAETDALRNSLKDSKLRLKELKIGAVGERRFM